MRKIFTILVILLMAVSTILPLARASDEQALKIWIKASASATTTLASVTTQVIPGKCRILGYAIAPITNGSGTMGAGLYDVASTGSISSSNIFAEISCANTTSHEVIFPHPYPISAGLVVQQNAATTVTVYYEQNIP